MRSKCLLQLFFALSSLIVSKARDVFGSGLSCVTSSAADDGETRVTFLREDPAGARALYLTRWSEDERLRACEVNLDPVTTERYQDLCDKGGTNVLEIIQRFNLSAVLAPDAPCALGTSGAQKFFRRARNVGNVGKTRIKRGVIFPGTLWCGTGSRAAGYDQLGMFESADKCCREHDHCQHVIPAFSHNYGVFNSKFFTVSYCECDQRFRQCLLDVNDTISSMVGYSFFNILKVPCFELKQQKHCTNMYWWGMCKIASVAPYAVFKTPLPYNSSDVTSKYNADINKVMIQVGQNATESPVINTKSPRSEHRCSSREPPRGDTFQRRRKNKKRCERQQTLSTVAPVRMLPVSKVHTSTPLRKNNTFNTSTLASNRKAGKRKGARKHMFTSSPQDRLSMTTTSYPQTTSTTQALPFLTQKPLLQPLVPTITKAVTKTIKRHRGGARHSKCCRVKMPLRGDAFQLHCKKRCRGRKRKQTTHTATVTPSATTFILPVKWTMLTKHQMKKTEEAADQETLKTHRKRDKSTNPMPTASSHKNGDAQKLKDSQLPSNSTNQESKGRTTTKNIPAERGLKDNHLLCESLKHLDNCEYKILPLEKKYDLRNKERKTAYHCDCTSSLALQIESFSQPSILPMLIMDSVSRFCFKLPKEKKCSHKKSCSGGFTKASDLLRTLKKIEEKDTAGVQNSVSGRKRGIPVRLSKRCLRLQREADIMAQLTRL